MTVQIFFQLVRFRETLFALPWVFVSALLTARFVHLSLTGELIILFILATFFARTSAMSFNRYFDRKIDALNPRTKHRLLPTNQVSANIVLAMASVSLFGFIASCFLIHTLCFQLSFGIAILIATYPLFKRFSYLCHFVLGWVQFFIPVMASLAICGTVMPPAILLGMALFFMISGIDIIYATQDIDFDVEYGVYSLAKVCGVKGAFGVAFCLHLAFGSCLILSLILFEVGILSIAGALVAMGLVFSQYHFLLKDLNNLSKAFFWCNSLASVILFVFVTMDFLWAV